MELVVFFVFVLALVLAAARGNGSRKLWFGLALVAGLTVLLGVPSSVADTAHLAASSLAKFSSQRNVPVQTPQPPSPPCREMGGAPCGPGTASAAPGARTGDADPTPATQKSRWPMGLAVGASLGFLLAGIFSRKPKEEQAAAGPAAPPQPPIESLVSQRAAPPQEFSIERRSARGVTILDMTGRLQLGQPCDTFRREVLDLLREGQRNFLVNLENVAKADSAGIGVMVETLIQTTKEGGKLKLLKVPRMIHNVLAVHRLLPVFEMLDDEEQALGSFE